MMNAGILPSRQELLSRIEMMCELDSSFVAVTGDIGIGKSAVLEFFIEHQCLARKKCYIQALPEQTPDKIREQLLIQLLPNSSYDPYLSLGQNISSSLTVEPLAVIVVIDNAQYVASEIFLELIELLKDPNHHQLCVIFAQNRDAAKFNQLNNAHPLIEMHLESLSIQESRMLLSFYFAAINAATDVSAFIEQCSGNPAKLLKWQAPTKKSAQSRGRLSLKQIITITAVAVLLLVMIAASWFFIPADIFQRGSNQANVEPAILPSQPVSKPTLTPVSDQAANEQSDEAQATSGLEQLLVKEWDSDTKEDSDSVKTHNDAVMDDEQGKDTVIIDKAVDAVVEDIDESTVIDDAAASVDDDNDEPIDSVEDESPSNQRLEQSTEQAFEQLQVAQQSQTQQSQVTDATTNVAANSIVDDNSDEQNTLASEAAVTDSKMDNQWFLDQPDSHVAIQLAGVSNIQVLETYLVEHQLKNRAHIYQSVRKGRAWYVVTVGSFANHQLAREAIGQLSAPLQATEPWVKSIRTIQSEIINANKKTD